MSVKNNLGHAVKWTELRGRIVDYTTRLDRALGRIPNLSGFQQRTRLGETVDELINESGTQGYVFVRPRGHTAEGARGYSEAVIEKYREAGAEILNTEVIIDETNAPIFIFQWHDRGAAA